MMKGSKRKDSKDVGVATRKTLIPQFRLLVSYRTAQASRRGWDLHSCFVPVMSGAITAVLWWLGYI